MTPKAKSRRKAKITFPSKEHITEGMKRRTNIRASAEDGKLYTDPEYSIPEIHASVKYAVINGNWTVESYEDEDGSYLKFKNDKFSDSIMLAFPSIIEKMSFAEEICSDSEIKKDAPTHPQDNGTDIVELINEKNEKTHKLTTKQKVIGGAVLGTALLGTVLLAWKIKNKKIKQIDDLIGDSFI